MRLIIDSDMAKMPRNCHECFLCYGGWCTVMPSEQDGMCPDSDRPEWCPLSEDIYNAHTIDAIPVEWLQEHDSKGNEYGRRYITVVEALSMWQEEQEART